MELLIKMLKGNEDHRKKLFLLKSTCDLNEMIWILERLTSYNKYKSLLVDEMFPWSYDSILLKGMIPYIFMDEKRILYENMQELKFLAALIILHKGKICRFIQLRKEYEMAYMRGDIAGGENILSILEKEFGISYWFIESKLMLLQNDEGSITSFSYYSEIMEKCSDEKVWIYVQVLRDKVAEDIGEPYFNSKLDTYFENLSEVCGEDEIDLRHNYKKYIEFMCCYKKRITPYDLENLLAMSKHLGIIDRFILFEKILVRISADLVFDDGFNYKSEILLIVQKMEQNIVYPVWNNIMVLLCENSTIKVEIHQEKLAVHKALGLYCEKKQDECVDECRKQLEIYPTNISLMNLLAKCTDEFDKTRNYEKIAALLNCLYRKEGEVSETVKQFSEYDVYERMYSGFSFGLSLLAIIEHEIEYDLTCEKILYVASLMMYGFTPSKLVFFVPDINKKRFLSIYREYCHPLYFCDWQISTYEEASDEIMDEFLLDSTSRSLREIEFASADKLKVVYRSTDLAEKSKEKKEINTFLIKKLFDYHVESKHYFSAIEIYLDAYFVSSYLVRRTNFKKLNRRLKNNVRRALEINIEYCIYISITKFGVNDSEAVSEYVVSSYKRIMESHNEIYPSRLEWPTDEKARKSLAYFLFNVCSKDVLGRVLFMEEDVNDERVRIVDKLLQYYTKLNDKESIATLLFEKRRLNQEKETLSIANCIHKGKVNIDWICLKDLTDDAIFVAFERMNKKKGMEKEVFHEFVEGFTEVKKDYVQEINKLLSICIRHGTLEYYLISYFNRRGIVAGSSEQRQVNPSIKNFFSHIYALINKINQEYINFTDKKKKDHFRSLYIEEKELKDLFVSTNMPSQPIGLKDIYLRVLNQKLKIELELLGENVYDILKENIYKDLIELDKCIDNSMRDQVKVCIDQLDMGLQQIKEWFAFAKNQMTPYKFDAWLEVMRSEYTCLEIQKGNFDDFSINGNSVTCLYNVFNNFLFNVVRHSGYSEIDPLLKLKLEIEQKHSSETQKKIRFKITNRVNPNKDQGVIIKDVYKIRELIEKKDCVEKYQTEEGKSGYKKIIRLLEKGFGDCWKMNVGYEPDINIFWVDLVIIFRE